MGSKSNQAQSACGTAPLALQMDATARGQWQFLGGDWEQDADGIIRPPRGPQDENLAIYAAAAFTDFEAEFDYRWENICCGGGFVFRARDARRYYLIDFPCTGQQYRAEYFWAAVCKTEESGWTKVLRTEIMPGTPSEIGTWHKCRLVVKGNQIRLWVNGRPFSLVSDDTYAGAGYVGLYSYDELGGARAGSFRNVRICGSPAETHAWDPAVEPLRNWSYPTLEETYGKIHHLGGMTKAPNGDILIKLHCCDKYHGAEVEVPVTVRSTDGGRTWSKMHKLDEHLAHGMLHTTRDGRLLMMSVDYRRPHPIRIAESTDNGNTWPPYRDCGKLGFPEEVEEAYMMGVLELRNGDLVWPLYNHTPSGKELPDRYGSYTIRSSDGGRSWEPPVNMNGPKPEGFENFGMVPKHFGSEVSVAETRQGSIVGFVRPYFEPTMWETWSHDGGRTWTPAARGPFGMWACHCAMLSTASGALLVAGRHPGLAFQLSRDDGITWECWRFDTTFWANGIACEIAPDLVMFGSTAKYADPHVRLHLFQITPEGPKPVRY